MRLEGPGSKRARRRVIIKDQQALVGIQLVVAGPRGGLGPVCHILAAGVAWGPGGDAHRRQTSPWTACLLLLHHHLHDHRQ